MDPPVNLRSLVARIHNAARASGADQHRAEVVVAAIVLTQMLPDGVVKGGTALQLCVGASSSRFTQDVDASRISGQTTETYVAQLVERLRVGWAGFTATVERLEPAEPAGVPTDYVMQPFRVRLAYLDRAWRSVPFELGHDEVGSTENPTIELADEIIDLFATIGLPPPAPVPVMRAEHQIAQKLHACTSPSGRGPSQRAHDLVDLQLLWRSPNLDLAAIDTIGQRLFARAAPMAGRP